MTRIKRTGSGGAAAPAVIREATERDAGAVIALWTEAYVREGGGRTAPYVEDDFAKTMSHARVLVAERGESVVGVVAMLAPGSPGRAVAEGKEVELSRFAVAGDEQRRGVGRTLVEHCLRLTRTEGWPAIALWSRRYQAAAHRLYESLGFQREPARDTVDETGHERVVFRHPLHR